MKLFLRFILGAIVGTAMVWSLFFAFGHKFGGHSFESDLFLGKYVMFNWLLGIGGGLISICIGNVLDNIKELTKCKWMQDDDGAWHTGCKQIFVTVTGLPSENGMKFCPFCGAELVEWRFAETENQE